MELNNQELPAVEFSLENGSPGGSVRGPNSGDPLCYHCKEPLQHEIHFRDDHPFCCAGCLAVYDILNSAELCNYYVLEGRSNSQQGKEPGTQFEYLDLPEIQAQLLDFQDDQKSIVNLQLPQIHCSSCIWLLENLQKLDSGIQKSRVHFGKRQVWVMFDSQQTSLRKICELLTQIGYEPAIHLDSVSNSTKQNRQLSYQLGIAGFCFGNIMLLSFPEYLGIDIIKEPEMVRLFGYLNVLLSLPVILYSGKGYLIGAWSGIKTRSLTIDFPLALGLVVLFLRSAYEIFTQTGAGYMDTLAGLVFFLLIGRWFQSKTYESLSFERDFRSYFPLAVLCKNEEGDFKPTPIDQIATGNILRIRHEELIPADGVLMAGEGHIDYSFVTGESMPVSVMLGEKVFAGGKQMGGPIELETIHAVKHSYLTTLWNKEDLHKAGQKKFETFQTKVSRWFTLLLIIIAAIAGLYWVVMDISKAMNAFTAVLIIGCPCALALSSPFALGNAMRMMGRNGYYLKNITVVESLAHTQRIVFDKTGTITTTHQTKLKFAGNLNEKEQIALGALASAGTHPLSRLIAQNITVHGPLPAISHFQEIKNRGVAGEINGQLWKLGRASFVCEGLQEGPEDIGISRIYYSCNGELKGYAMVTHAYREGISEMMDELRRDYDLNLLSGDHEGEAKRLSHWFGQEKNMKFRCTPHDKKREIEQYKLKGEHVLMAGDGLNDAGALLSADVGISVTENMAGFTPASDIIAEAQKLYILPKVLKYAKAALRTVHLSFGISLCYNIIGISFAIQGTMSPIVAAILMPVSSITIISFTTLSTTWQAKRILKI